MAEYVPPLDDLSVTQSRRPIYAVSGLIMAMGLIALGNGLMFGFVPLKLALLGQSPQVAAWLLTVMAAGGFLGCVLTGPIVRRVGHARAFMTLAAATILSHAVLALSADPLAWGVARVSYGGSVTGLFIVTQTWLNDATPNAWRGRVLSIFYMFYVLGIGMGGFLIGQVDLSGAAAPVIAIVLVAMAIVAAGTTSLKSPDVPAPARISFVRVWAISPVGLAGALAVGGLTMLVQGFAPIYAQSEGFTAQQVGLLLLLMQFGMIVIQTPLGALSDRVDRRYVLVLACALVAGVAGATFALPTLAFWGLVVMFGIWAGATETVFSVATAHANDRATPDDALQLSTTMLLGWSISGFVIPAAATALTPVAGTKSFMLVACALSLCLAAFILLRILRYDRPKPNDAEPYRPQVPIAPELFSEAAAREDDLDPDQGRSASGTSKPASS